MVQVKMPSDEGSCRRIANKGSICNVTVKGAIERADVKVWFSPQSNTSYITENMAKQLNTIYGNPELFDRIASRMHDDTIKIKGLCDVHVPNPMDNKIHFIDALVVNKLPFNPPENDIDIIVSFTPRNRAAILKNDLQLI